MLDATPVTSSMSETLPVEIGTKLSPAQQAIYDRWVEIVGWLEELADRHQGELLFERESDMLAFISHMERPYSLPTHVQAVSLRRRDGRGHKLFAAVSRPGGLDRKIEIRYARVRQVLEARAGGLAMNGLPYDRERLLRTSRQAGLI